MPTTTHARGYELSLHRVQDGLHGLLGDDATTESVEHWSERIAEIVNRQLGDFTWLPATSEVIGPVDQDLTADMGELIAAAEKQVQEELFAEAGE